MGFSGFYQLLCPNGHYFHANGVGYGYYGDNIMEEKCPDCGEKVVWENLVDDTNGENAGYIEMRAFLVTEAEYETCNLGHNHFKSPSIYRIPTPEETEQSKTHGGKPYAT